MSEQRRGPGRPPRGEKAHAPKDRPKRVPMSQGTRLYAPEIEGFQQYWAKEGPNCPGVLAKFKAAYWVFVLDEAGQKVTVPAGGGDTHYLMKIEQEYYDEDIAAQQARNIDATTADAQRLGEGEYVPMGKKAVVEREIV